MKKPVLYILALLTAAAAALILTNCGRTEYDFINDVSAITAIEIVQFEDFGSDPAADGTVLAVIDDKEAFITDFRCMECHELLIFSPPAVIDLEARPVIRIFYDSGEYELISPYGQGKHIIKDGEGIYTDSSYQTFNLYEYTTFVGRYTRKL